MKEKKHSTFSIKMDEQFMRKYNLLDFQTKKQFLVNVRKLLNELINEKEVSAREYAKKVNEQAIRKQVEIEKKAYQDKMNFFENRLKRINFTSPKRKGVCYIISSDNLLLQDCYKIGMTYDFKSRLQQLQCASPYILKEVLLIESEQPKMIERELHKKYSQKRVNNEWFNLSEDDLNNIKKRYGVIE